MRNKVLEVIMYLHPLIQELQMNFYKEKLKSRGFKDYWNVFANRKGIGGATFENWRKEFTRKELLKAQMIPITSKTQENIKTLRLKVK